MPIAFNMKVPTGEDIKTARKSKGLTQSAVAEEADVSQAYLSRVENEDVDPRITTLHRVAAAINDSEAVQSDEHLTIAVRELVRERRHEAGITQAELAERVGVSQPLIARIESETVNPRSSTFREILSTLDPLTETNRATEPVKGYEASSEDQVTSEALPESDILDRMASSFTGFEEP